MPPFLNMVSVGLVNFKQAFIFGLFILLIIYFYYFLTWHKRKRVGLSLEKNILKKLPFGIVIIDNNGEIVWCNPAFKEITGRCGFLAGKLKQYLPNLQFKKHSQFQKLLTKQVTIHDKIYQTTISILDNDLKMIFLQDITEQTFFVEKKQTEKPVIGIIQIDNYYEVLESTAEEIRPLLLADLDKLIGDWALEREAFIKKISEDKYLIFLTAEALKYTEDDKFSLLDKVRSMDGGKIPVTISMGFGIREDSLIDLGRLAQLALELALGRGGDQVVVKSPDKVWFYGGKSQALEKRTKVKARVIAHSLRDMVLEAAKVIIMGHAGADYDSLGSALGLAAVIEKLGIEPYIITDTENEALNKLLKVLDRAKLPGTLIKSKDIPSIDTTNSLLIIVDTHKPDMVIEPDLLKRIEKIVVIDHHRRGEEFIDTASLAYLEPYASSACELVTELIQYFGEEIELDKLAATALLAGITVDTKNFIFQTGVRTFDAASYLRQLGADPVLVQKLLRDDLNTVHKKAIIIENSQIVKEKIAISYYPEITEEPQVLAAQGADALLNIDNIEASFVFCPLHNGGVTISARSTGETNVQVLMEKLGGGGHLTVAGVQLKNISLEEVKKTLIQLIEENY